ncbi:MAG: 50S ribosomal protein L9 [Synergistaceae bacterium]|jgi:large subunit ribosomal protein L9|uniref:50S ribosomal protein L9 n=1 Tax=Aminivibrio sp. TaxID=1872489 RepID=UPI0016A5BDEB|nr:50S ribosomal protein L9 [Synergistaceae bacterium]NCC58314.1 50S ribosomal protein L9 [Synergistales bacterium]MDD3390237.1 50S ribosomal protein L9 [Synergistaceae bacterium]MDD3689358.1 50S ribosomal protein L9 [Synergistaceae bacterium]MDD4020178.1 50S ribosomal protein L9 [Synergistaceae bacterium]
MKVILKQDVNKIGTAGEMVETSDGYARNFLFPRNLAEEATPERIKEWKDKEASKKKKEERLQKEARELQKRLSGKTVRVRASMGEKGKLFGSITTAAVAENLVSQYSASIDKRDIRMPETVKQTGSYPFTVKLYTGIEAEMNLLVESE